MDFIEILNRKIEHYGKTEAAYEFAAEEYANRLIKEAQTKQLTLYGVVSSFLDKESKSLGIKKEDLYLNLCDNELSLMAENTNDYYFSLRIEKIIDK